MDDVCDYDGFHSFSLSFTPMMCAQLLRLQKKQSKMFLTLYTPIQRALDGLDVWYQTG